MTTHEIESFISTFHSESKSVSLCQQAAPYGTVNLVQGNTTVLAMLHDSDILVSTKKLTVGQKYDLFEGARRVATVAFPNAPFAQWPTVGQYAWNVYFYKMTRV